MSKRRSISLMDVLIVIALVVGVLRGLGIVEIKGNWLGPACPYLVTDCN
jgi:hypothetical protein